MAKLKISSTAPKKDVKGKSLSVTKKTVQKAPSKSLAASKRRSSKNVVSDDSGISSVERSSRKKVESERSSSKISKVSSKSKSSISKHNRSSLTVKKVKLIQVEWLKGLVNQNLVRRDKGNKSGISVRHLSDLKLIMENGIEYAQCPHNDGTCLGYIKIPPGIEKGMTKTGHATRFNILSGEIELHSGHQQKTFTTGSVFSVSKGCKYGLFNNSDEICFLQYRTSHEETYDSNN